MWVHSQADFDTPEWSLLKTFVMMIGEFEYADIFNQNLNDVPFPYYSVIIFVVFVLVMSIAVSNLLVGLAVDDIKEIQDNAELHQLSMNVSLTPDPDTRP
jgi:transient receptor potential cation channel subfamily A protein 1